MASTCLTFGYAARPNPPLVDTLGLMHDRRFQGLLAAGQSLSSDCTARECHRGKEFARENEGTECTRGEHLREPSMLFKLGGMERSDGRCHSMILLTMPEEVGQPSLLDFYQLEVCK